MPVKHNNDRCYARNITPIATCEKTVNDLLSFEENLGERDWKAWKKLLKNKNK